LRRGGIAVRALAATLVVGGAAYLAAPSKDPLEEAAPVAAAQGKRIPFGGGRPHRIELGGTQREVASILRTSGPMAYGQFLWDEEGVPQGAIWVRVDLAAQTLSVFRAGHEIGTAVSLHGADGKPTPRGRFPVLEKRRDHQSNLYDATMPYMMRLTWDGVAIHGSEVKARAATHGCVGVPLAFGARLFDALKPGDEVFIV
jgi:hypothetical protein